MYIFFHSHRMHQTCSGNKPDSTQVCESTCLKFTFPLVYVYIHIISYYEHKLVSETFLKDALKPHFLSIFIIWKLYSITKMWGWGHCEWASPTIKPP